MFRPLLLILAFLLTPMALAAADNWPGFRGHGDSHAAGELPLTWDDEQHVAWKCDLPGYGQSSPVVWNDQIFVTGIKGENKEALYVACVDLKGGSIVWQKEFPPTKQIKVTDYIGRAAPTPVVDANRVYAFYETGDLVALTHTGEQVWTRSVTKDYGEIQGNHGLGGSPAQTDNAVILLIDHAGPSYLVAFDKATGAPLWKKDRESRVSWSSPVVVDGENGQEILVSSNGVAQSFSAKDGELIWEVKGLKGNTTNSPSVGPEGVLIGAGQPGDNLLIRRGGKGDITESHIAWRAAGVSSSFGSPVLHNGRAYFVNKTGIAFAVNMANGETLWSQRLPDSPWASSLAAGDRIYYFLKNGTTVVVEDGATYKKLAENKLTLDGRLYGVAVARGGILIRGSNRLLYIRDTKLAKAE